MENTQKCRKTVSLTTDSSHNLLLFPWSEEEEEEDLPEITA